MMNLEHLNSMDGYTFDEGIAFLVLVKAPLGVINHLKATHNHSHLHSEIHKQLRFPRVKEIIRRNMGNSPQISSNFPIENGEKSNETDAPTPTGSDPINRKSRPTADPDSDDETDPTEIILTKEDVRTHANTRLEDMPNDLCRTLWQKRQDVYREMQQAHLKMRAVPEGEEHNEERAIWMAEVLRLDAENDAYWQQIDEEIARFKSEQSRSPEASQTRSPEFDVSTYRAYISKALRKKKLTPDQLAELQHRVDAMLEAKVDMKPETLEKLKAIGINVG
jgi:hypothetical protein